MNKPRELYTVTLSGDNIIRPHVSLLVLTEEERGQVEQLVEKFNQIGAKMEDMYFQKVMRVISYDEFLHEYKNDYENCWDSKYPI